MDIDSPDSSPEGLVSKFSAIFPLPFRVLVLVGVGGLCWATNLHILDLLGIDTGQALQVTHYRPSSGVIGLPSHSPPPRLDPQPNGHSSYSASYFSASGSIYVHSSTLYPPVYKMVFAYMFLVGGGWLLFFVLTRADLDLVGNAKWIPAICYVLVLVAAIIPLQDSYGQQRSYFYDSLSRCLFSSPSQPVYFCDVITADVLTSFAKVLGDIWISTIVLLPGGSLKMTFMGDRLSDIAIPVLMSLPYAIRLRQCVVEFLGSGGMSQRPMYNAVKYATAFPVIFLSAAQRLLIEEEPDDNSRTWYGEYALFRLWLFAVLVNSAYSFWWDVTNDWGLTLLTSGPSNRTASPSNSFNPQPSLSQPASSMQNTNPSWHPTHHRRQSSFSHVPLSTPQPEGEFHIVNRPSFASQTLHPFGLRPNLLFRDPLVYYLVILLNFILRFTWSLKLSSHLHSIAELESGVFLMEALELIRRWMWVFLRVEWEVVKKTNEKLDEIPMEQQSLMNSVRGPSSSAAEVEHPKGNGMVRGSSLGFTTSELANGSSRKAPGPTVVDRSAPLQ